MRYDFVVIGAGVSGISSAITLARNGRSVLLLEKSHRIAPVLRGFSRQGVHFDTGFHYAGGLGRGGSLETFLRYLGVAGAIETFPFDENGFDLYRAEKERFEFRLPCGYQRISAELVSAFPAERAAIEKYLAQVRAICAAMPYQNLDAPFDGEGQLQRVFGPTLQEKLDALTGNELLKSILSMHTLLYGVPADEVSFAQHAVIVGNYYDSAHGIRGGGLSLARAFEARLAELGVEVRCGCEVTGISAGGDGACTGVTLATGESISAKGCIATVHPRLLLDLVPQGIFRPAYRNRLASLQETISAFLAYAVCDAPLPELSGRNRFLLPDAAALREIGKRRLGEVPCYLSGAYRDGAAVANGMIAIFPANFGETAPWRESCFGKRPEGYLEFKEKTLEEMRRQIERLAPDLAGSIASMEASTPLTIRDYCGGPEGGLYGVKHMVGQYNPLPTTRMQGLHLAGQALVAPGVMGAVISGLVACGTMLGHEHMRKELKRCC
jgi:all-trans-retinol 13,14-reductase